MQTDSQRLNYYFYLIFCAEGCSPGGACCQQLNKNPFHVNATFVALPNIYVCTGTGIYVYRPAKQTQLAALWLCTCLCFGFCCCGCGCGCGCCSAAVLQLFPINDKNHMTRTGRRSGFVFCSFSLGRALFLSPLRFSIWRRRH